jgi:hypothetical protein
MQKPDAVAVLQGVREGVREGGSHRADWHLDCLALEDDCHHCTLPLQKPDIAATLAQGVS